MRRIALVMLVGPAYAVGYVLRNGGLDGQFQVDSYVMSGRKVLVAAWAAGLAIVALSHAIRTDSVGKRRVIAPGSAFAGVVCLLTVIVLVGSSGSTLDWLRFG